MGEVSGWRFSRVTSASRNTCRSSCGVCIFVVLFQPKSIKAGLKINIVKTKEMRINAKKQKPHTN
jgi:hypothetical protein